MAEPKSGQFAPVASDARPPAASELRRLLRASTLLDPLLRRQRLKVVNHLDAADRSRLAEILRAADEGQGNAERERPR
jgi:hypothetical protein